MAEALATIMNDSPCRGGFETRPYIWTFTVKPSFRNFEAGVNGRR